MEIVVRGRNVEVPEHYRQHVEDKVGQLERFDTKLSRIDVELFHEKNPRQSANCQRVEITLHVNGKDFVTLQESEDMYLSVDRAVEKLEEQLKRYSGKLKRRKKATGLGEVSGNVVEEE